MAAATSAAAVQAGQARLCAGRADKPAARCCTGLCGILLKAPPQPTFDQRWTAWGSAFGGSNRTNGDPAVGSNTRHRQHLRLCRRHGLSRHAGHGRRLCARRRRHQLGLGQRARQRPERRVPGRRLRHQRFGPAYVAGALAFTNHWFTTSRSALGDQLNANFIGQSYGARARRRLPLRGAADIRRDAVRAPLQAQDFHTPATARPTLTGGGFGLSYAAMNATDMRSELGSRFDASDAGRRHAAGAAAGRLGA